jgi:hypothetical protein
MPWINSRYTVKCAECGEAIFAGERCWWDPDARNVYCEGNECAKEMEDESERGNRTATGILRLHLHEGLAGPKCLDCYHQQSEHGRDGCKRCGCLRRFAQPTGLTTSQ